MSAEPVRSVSSVLSFGSAMSSGTRAPACVAAAALRRSASLSSVPTVMVDGGLDDWAPDVVAGAVLRVNAPSWWASRSTCALNWMIF